jgi:PadR family transcriptional regulator PadR
MALESIRRGFLAFFVLHMLNEHGEMYGYQMCQTAKTKYGRDLKYGTLYPLLGWLEKGGVVEGIKRDSPRGPYRKYYRLTDKGKGIFQDQRAEIAQYFGLQLSPG